MRFSRFPRCGDGTLALIVVLMAASAVTVGVALHVKHARLPVARASLQQSSPGITMPDTAPRLLAQGIVFNVAPVFLLVILIVSIVYVLQAKKQDCIALQAVPDKMLALKKEYAAVAARVRQARNMVAARRAEPADLKAFPDCCLAPYTMFALIEENGNPDHALSVADAALERLATALMEGKVDQAQTAKEAALAAAAEAVAIVEAVMAAKAQVEEKARGLQTHFPSASDGFMVVRSAYAQQEFLGAAVVVQAYEKMAALRLSQTSMQNILQAETRFTSSDTDQSFIWITQVIDTLLRQAAVAAGNPDLWRLSARNVVADPYWRTLSGDAGRVAAVLDKLVGRIGKEKQAYFQARAAVSSLRARLSAAGADINYPGVDDSLRLQLDAVSKHVEQLEAAIATGFKLDWRDIAEQAAQAGSLLASVCKTACN